MYLNLSKSDEIWNAQSKMFHSDKCRPIRPHEQWTKLQESFETTPSERNHVNTYVSAFRSWKHASPDGNPSATFAQIVSEAFIQRVSLLASAGCAPNPDGYPERQDFDRDWFGYYIYACAWTQVEVDGVTGELDVLRSEIFYDAGGSRNPATDIGQVEGAFVQGLGNILTEECQYDFSTGRKVCGLEGRVQKDVKYQTGRLQQRSIMEYAIPSHRSIPRKMVSFAL
jgi:xanthine dehydrogenase molybdopterin-binding subunit B